MLMVTTTKGMLYGVLGHTTDLGPAIAFDSVFVIGGTGFEHGFIGTAPTSNDSDLSPDGGGHRFLAAAGQSETRGTLFIVVGDDDGEAARPASQGPAITQSVLHVTHHRSFGHFGEGQDVPHGERGLFPAVHELSGVHALRAHQQLVIALVFVGVTELDLGHGGAAAGVVKDFLHHAPNVSVFLRIVQSSELDRTFPSPNMRLEDGCFTLTLGLWRDRQTDRFAEVMSDERQATRRTNNQHTITKRLHRGEPTPRPPTSSESRTHIPGRIFPCRR